MPTNNATMVNLNAIKPGRDRTAERTFTHEDVERSANLCQDEEYHHLIAHSDGSVLVHGLVTATLARTLGTDIDFSARRRTFEFSRPAHTGQSIPSELTFDSLEERSDRYGLSASFECTAEEIGIVRAGEMSGVG